MKATDSTAQRDPALNAPSDHVFHLMVQAVRDCSIFLLTPDGRIVTWNAGAERIHGYPASEAIGERAVEELTNAEPHHVSRNYELAAVFIGN